MKSSFTYLLAKSYDKARYIESPPDYALLTQHSRDVAAACNAIAKAIGTITLFNAGITEITLELFSLALRTNGWMQDLGKSNSHFQRMLQDRAGILSMPQLLRHETISGMLVWTQPAFRNWLSELPPDVFIVSLWAAMGHHRKFDRQTKPADVIAPLEVFLTHPDVTEILKDMSVDLELSEPPEFSRNLIICLDNRQVCDISARQALRDLQDDFIDFEDAFTSPIKRRFLALVKGLGIAADVAASALAAKGKFISNYSIADFITESLTETGLSVQDFERLITKRIWSASGRDFSLEERVLPAGFSFRAFQIEVAESVSYLTLAQAGCGSGKSLAAYLWGLKWCKLAEAEGRRNLRFFFCLPTTGTTTEHFKDYALESGIETSLTHSRSVVDLRTMAETTADEEATTVQEEASEAAKNNLQVMQDKIQALALWSTPLTVTTADTVLGLMVNARKSIYSLPAIMNSVVVFDEIHAFDEHLFGHLLAFLKHFPNIPILLMTASLPEDRKRALTIIRPDLQSLSGPPAFELLERYEIRREIKSEQVLDCIGKCLESDGKVLWVRNRVDWANKAYADCHQRFSTLASVDIYHSRFRYGDRADRHRRVIDRFRHGKRGCVLVATQVAEMSLDLSADLLITDLAPIPALIQRMGRLNRYSTPESPGIPREALIIPFPSLIKNGALPYKESELETTKDWLCQLRKMNRALCQRDLAEVFEQVAALKEIDLTKTDDQAIFFSGLWQTRPGLTRDQSYTMSVILQKDRDKCSELNSVGEPTQDWLKRHEVSVPIRDSMLRWPRIGYLPVAPHNEIHYDYDEQTKEGTGALWL